MCFVSATTSDGNQVTYIKLGGAQRLPIDDSDNRTQQKVYERDKRCCYSGGRQITGASKNAHCGRTPKRGSRVQTANAQSFAKNQPGSKKADT